MKLLALTLLVYFSTIEISVASTTDSIPVLHHSIGVSGSMITGFGVSYRYNFDNQYYIKTIGAAYYTGDNTTHSSFTSFVGLEFQRNLIQTSSSRLYGFVGVSYWYDKSQNTSSSSNGQSSVRIDEKKNVGVGFSFEATVWKHFLINLDFGFQYGGFEYRTRGEYEHYQQSFRIGMSGGLGFGYQF